MLKSLLAAAALVVLSGPAAAVTVTGTTVSGGNAVTVLTQGPGLLEADIALRAFSPITLDLAAKTGETGFEFNSLVDVFTGVELGQNLGKLTLSLRGATFATPGTIVGSFSLADWSLNGAADRLTIRFKPAGEGLSVLLGDVDGPGENFAIDFAKAGGTASLVITSAGVPEPASWALMIAGFGLVGAAARRRNRAAQA